MYLLSCPPISKTVSASGTQCAAPFACAVISSRTASAPIRLPMRSRPEPVTPTAVNRISPNRWRILARPLRTAPSGSPAVRRYWKSTSSPSGPTRTRSVLVEPMSMPSAQPFSGRIPVAFGSERSVPGNSSSLGSPVVVERVAIASFSNASSCASVNAPSALHAAPMAASKRASSGTISSALVRPNTSRIARITPELQVTPPQNTTGLQTGSRRTMVAL